MKKNDYLLITLTVAYSYLFYTQNAGINFLLFNLVFIICLLLRNINVLRERKWAWAAVLCLVSSVSVFVHSSALAVFANCVSLLLLSAFSFNSNTSSMFSFLFSIFSLASSPVYIIIDAVKRSGKNNEVQETGIKKSYKVFVLALVSVLCIIFFAIYKEANPLFAENTKWINLDFISLKWIVFTLGGFLLAYGLFWHRGIQPIEKWENGIPLTAESFNKENKRYEMERYAGLVLFAFINLMLLVLNAGDISSIWFNGKLPDGISHSDFVHSGVGLIILSIIIAVSLIMFLYRKNDSEIKYSKVLKGLVILWILQNLLMLFSTASRNEIYIEVYQLTYKRIGVYVWLVLAAIGLIILSVKIVKDKSNWFLVKMNFAAWFSVLAISSSVDWDRRITQYNISNKPIAQLDYHYLFSLSATNIPDLIALARNKDFEGLKTFTARGREEQYWTNNYLALLSYKIERYLGDYRNGWQSYDLRDKRIFDSLFNP